MDRLTTNKPVNEMSMLELAYNSCYADKDGNAMYEDFETVRSARDFVRNLYKVHLNEEMPTDDDIFDESMIDELQYEPEVHLNGLIALFYRNLWAMADLRETLKSYEDKEEQGLLIEAKCRVGGYVYYPVEDFNVVIPVRINEIVISDLGNGKSCFQYNGITFDGSGDVYEEYEFDDNDFGKIVFATRSEAEEALARMKGE